MDGNARCQFVKPDGTPCRGQSRTGRAFCFTHDPDSAAEREAARRAGGRERSKRAAVLPTAPDVSFGCVAEVVALLAETASQVRRGEMDTKVGNCLAYIAATACRALAGEELERRVKALEQAAAENKP